MMVLIHRELYCNLMLTNLIVDLHNDVVGVHNQLVLRVSLYRTYNWMTIENILNNTTKIA